MINKNQEVCKLIQWLQLKYNSRLVIEDHWDADISAIGIKGYGGSRLLYISTFSKSSDKYDFECEEIDEQNLDYNVLLKGKDVSKYDLCEIINSYILEE